MVSNATEHLVSCIGETHYSSLSAKAISEAKKCILDGLGVTVAGSAYGEMSSFRTYLREIGGEPRATTLGRDSIKTNATNAAFFNGIAGHILDFDDTQIALGGHPTVVLLPVVLALAEATGAIGKEILTAFIAGMEVSCKIARGVNPVHYRSGYHVTSTLGVFGAAAAAGILLKLGRVELLHALGIAGSMSAGLKENFGTMTKSVHVGSAASHGIMAAQLAQKGCTATRSILEGESGFGNVLSRNSDFRSLASFGAPWEIEDPGITRKKYPSCARTHAAIDAMLKLVGRHEIKDQDVEEIKCATDRSAFKILIHPSPKTDLEAKFSMPFCLAVALTEKDVLLKHFDPEKIRAPHLQALMRKVRHVADEEICSRGYEYRNTSRVSITTKAGGRFTEMVETCHGDPRNPLSDDDIAHKFYQCTDGVIGRKKGDSVIERVRRLEDQATLGGLIVDLTAP